MAESRPGRTEGPHLAGAKATLAELRAAFAVSERPSHHALEARSRSPSRGWRGLLGFGRGPLLTFFMVLAALSQYALVMALRRALTDGSISVADVVRVSIVAIIAGAFLIQAVTIVLSVTRLRLLWRRLRRSRRAASATWRPCVIPTLAEQELPSTPGLGAVSLADRAKLASNRRADDLFWIAVISALVFFVAGSAYALGYAAIADLLDGSVVAWSLVRLLLFVSVALMAYRTARSGVEQLLQRRSRRRKRAIRRLLRYLLWWGHAARESVSDARVSSRFATATTLAVVAAGTALVTATAAWSGTPATPGQAVAVEPESTPTAAATNTPGGGRR